VALRDKDSVIQFFKQFEGNVAIDSKDLEVYLSKNKSDPINEIALAMIFENTSEYKEALRIWKNSKSSDGCKNTVRILKKVGSKDLIFEFSEWVLKSHPDIGLQLFQGDTASIGIDPDQITQFLKRIEQENPSYPYKEKYLETALQSDSSGLEHYNNELAHLYVDKIFALRPPKAEFALKKEKEDELNSYREKFRLFIQTKKQYE